jgi:hypothetical protein
MMFSRYGFGMIEMSAVSVSELGLAWPGRWADSSLDAL